MAINIYQGSKQPKATVNSASSSSRAQASRDALAEPAETSPSGSVAVGTKGALQKVGNVAGKVLGTASKFMPGLAGTAAKVLSNLLNDPEWWQSVPGDAVTLNQALRPVANSSRTALRPAFLEVEVAAPGGANPWDFVISPTTTQITQYLLPQIRKVVNAVPLQDAQDYLDVLQANATIYAFWRQAKKMKYMITHGQTYIPSLNDSAFPLFQTTNSAFLDAVINRTEEYLRANVRLPHTLCEYLAWRFGRVYKTVDSLKAGCVLYDVISISANPTQWDAALRALMAIPTSSTGRQAANADLYNAYFDHDLMVEIRDDTQFTYDRKEFALRTNLDIGSTQGTSNDDPNFIYLDSALDNPTAFMASTVSTLWYDSSASTTRSLFPTGVMRILMYVPAGVPGSTDPTTKITSLCALSDFPTPINWHRPDPSSDWLELFIVSAPISVSGGVVNAADVAGFITVTQALKAMDVYNKDFLIQYEQQSISGTAVCYVDVSAPDFDLAMVQDYTIEQEQVYAFANLVDQTRKHSMSYKAAEKLVTREAAGLIEQLDVAAVQSPAPVK